MPSHCVSYSSSCSNNHHSCDSIIVRRDSVRQAFSRTARVRGVESFKINTIFPGSMLRVYPRRGENHLFSSGHADPGFGNLAICVRLSIDTVSSIVQSHGIVGAAGADHRNRVHTCDNDVIVIFIDIDDSLIKLNVQFLTFRLLLLGFDGVGG